MAKAKATATAILALRLSNVREYVPGDAAAIAKQGNNHSISQWMTNSFPNPYTLQDAHDWINHNLAIAAKGPSQNFLIVDPKVSYLLDHLLFSTFSVIRLTGDSSLITNVDRLCDWRYRHQAGDRCIHSYGRDWLLARRRVLGPRNHF